MIVQTLAQGDYTAILRGKNDTIGLGLVEVYDVQEGNGLKTANLATRAFVAPGDNAVIGGIINEGSASKRVILRGIGPSLQGKVAQPLADPMLQLFDVNGNTIATNDNYKDSAEIADIQASGLAPTDDREAVIAETLAPDSIPPSYGVGGHFGHSLGGGLRSRLS